MINDKHINNGNECGEICIKGCYSFCRDCGGQVLKNIGIKFGYECFLAQILHE